MLSPVKDAFGHTSYERHQPEQTLLYQLVEAHYPALVDQLAQQGKSLPEHVHREFDSILLQKARILPQLWRPSDGRNSGPSL